MLDESDINDPRLKSLFLKAKTGDGEAFNLLFTDSRIWRPLTTISFSVANLYRQDGDEVRAHTLEQTWKKIDSIKDFTHLCPYCHTVARNYCLNQIRHNNVVRDYSHDQTKTRESRKRGGKPMVDFTTVPTPEQELQIQEALQRATAPFPTWLVEGWRDGKSASELSEGTGRSLKTVYRKLKELQKAIIKEFEQ